MKVLNVAEIGANQKEIEIFIDHETFEAECAKAPGQCIHWLLQLRFSPSSWQKKSYHEKK